MVSSTTDSELLASVARKDKAALKELYHRHHDTLYRFAYSHCKDEHEASDIVQETMVAVWQTAEKFSGRSAVRSWMFSIARNKAIDLRRKLGRVDLTDQQHEQVDDAPDAQSIVAASQDAERVRACIDKLSDSHRRVVHFAFFEDLPYGEIGDIENAAVGTIKTRIFHAKKLLMQCLGSFHL